MKDLKTGLIALVVAGALAISCQNQKKTTVLNGRIENLSEGDCIFTLWFFDIDNGANTKLRFSADIDSTGYFKIKTDEITEPTIDAWLTIGNEVTQLGIAPGDSLYVELDARAFDETLKYSGIGAAKCNYKATKFLRYEDSQEGINFRYLSDLDSEAFLSSLNDLFDDRLALLDSVYGSAQKDKYYYDERDVMQAEKLNLIVEYLNQNESSPSVEEALNQIDLNDLEGHFYQGWSRNIIVRYIDNRTATISDPYEKYQWAKENLDERHMTYIRRDRLKNWMIADESDRIFKELKANPKPELDSANLAFHSLIEEYRTQTPTEPLEFIKFGAEYNDAPFTLKGKVLNTGIKKVNIYISGLAFKGQETIDVNEEGNFDFSFNPLYTRTITISAGNQFSQMIVSPGAALSIIMDDLFYYIGQGAKENKRLAEMAYSNIRFAPKYITGEEVTSMSEDEIKKELDKRYASAQQELSKYLKMNQLSKPLAIYLQASLDIQLLRMKAQAEMMKKYFVAPEEKEKVNFSKDYFQFLNDPALINDTLMITGELALTTSLINQVMTDKGLDFKIAEDPAYKEKLAITKCLESMSNNAYEQLDKDLVYLSQHTDKSWLVETVTSYKDQKMAYFETLVIPTGAELTANELSSADSLMSQIVEKHKGKNIYVDIWATWCGPCKAEFAYAEDFHKGLDEEKVSVVYLAARSKENNWKTSIAEYQLNGDHYFLTDEQYDQLAKKFELRGFPQYMIIDSNGKVQSTNAPRPSVRLTSLNTDLIEQLNTM
ncbi:TlpA family protein disulfide reductase [Reichenbachiella ulvae]|uniref:TlpA family protein disulfide reductase n=1 Tax=Reichenbachiella ulvae TaxID=2980104 RepID=A0ABT3CTL6_9BACT|nr:TlpA disulfide reductase family protein [Reichenbachiella ulvae]MCV9387051.1 TlpA family protein disulfide reductase [Reichenbachiella ulvae]